MRISDWSSDVCSSDLQNHCWSVHRPHSGEWCSPKLFDCQPSEALKYGGCRISYQANARRRVYRSCIRQDESARTHRVPRPARDIFRSEEHTSELQSLMRISYAVFCLKKKRQ